MSCSFSPAWLAATAKPQRPRRRAGYFLNSGGRWAILAAIRNAVLPVAACAWNPLVPAPLVPVPIEVAAVPLDVAAVAVSRKLQSVTDQMAL